MEELLTALEGATNVKSITYQRWDGQWKIVYKQYILKDDYVSSENLIDFLSNA